MAMGEAYRLSLGWGLLNALVLGSCLTLAVALTERPGPSWGVAGAAAAVLAVAAVPRLLLASRFRARRNDALRGLVGGTRSHALHLPAVWRGPEADAFITAFQPHGAAPPAARRRSRAALLEAACWASLLAPAAAALAGPGRGAGLVALVLLAAGVVVAPAARLATAAAALRVRPRPQGAAAAA
ncbi:MAG TPA: hypothetical protein VFH47_08180 [Candidatus Thermoplasmatota archaeon]|nr:hypothetical protein [Candidatus Thermoplasmatota archaeon]